VCEWQLSGVYLNGLVQSPCPLLLAPQQWRRASGTRAGGGLGTGSWVQSAQTLSSSPAHPQKVALADTDTQTLTIQLSDKNSPLICYVRQRQCCSVLKQCPHSGGMFIIITVSLSLCIWECGLLTREVSKWPLSGSCIFLVFVTAFWFCFQHWVHTAVERARWTKLG